MCIRDSIETSGILEKEIDVNRIIFIFIIITMLAACGIKGAPLTPMAENKNEKLSVVTQST